MSQGVHEERDQERRGHARDDTAAALFALASELDRPKPEPDQEHVEPDAELRAGIEDALVSLGNSALQVGKEQAEQRRPEDHAGDHLADDLGLAEEAPAESANHPRGTDDHEQLEKDDYAEFLWCDIAASPEAGLSLSWRAAVATGALRRSPPKVEF